MAEPHGEYRPYATAIDTFNQPSGGVDLAGLGVHTSSSRLDEDENIAHELENFLQVVSTDVGQLIGNRRLQNVFVSHFDDTGIGLPYIANETVDRDSTSEPNYWALRYFALLKFIQQRLRPSANPEWFTVNISPPLTEYVITEWFENLVEEAREPGETMPPDSVTQESRRIVTRLRNELPQNTDIYPDDDGKVAIEFYGEPGNAFLLVCEPRGSALCIVTVEGISRRARYESSSLLPDGFVREGIRDVRPDTHQFSWFPTFDW